MLRFMLISINIEILGRGLPVNGMRKIQIVTVMLIIEADTKRTQS